MIGRALVITLGMLMGVAAGWPAGVAAAPELPREYVALPTSVPAGRTLTVSAGGDFQKALDEARPGDVIELQAGAVFRGPFILPNKQGEEWITIRSSRADATVPGARVSPALSSAFAILEAPKGMSAIRASLGAHHFRFIAVEVRPIAGAFTWQLVDLGSDARRLDDVPHHIVFERSYFHGDPVRGTRRGIALNSAHTAVVDSYLSDFKEVGADSQAICGWGGPGPFKIVNNYLEGAGENVMFGGADPVIPGLVPTDIEIRRNHFSKPLAWKRGEPSFAGTPWTVKNLFELKNARRVLVDGNVFEHNWIHAQSGFAILFTVRNQRGTAPWSVVRDVTFTNNLVRRSAGGVNILARDDLHPSEHASAILIRNNVFAEIGDPRWGPNSGVLFQLLRGTIDLVIDHNTGRAARATIMSEGPPNSGFVFTNNVVELGRYGVVGRGTGPGRDTLRVYFPGAAFERNVFVGGGANMHGFPGGNYFVGTLGDVGFVDVVNGDFRLSPSSPFSRRDTRGGAVGADVELLGRTLNGVVQSADGTTATTSVRD